MLHVQNGAIVSIFMALALAACGHHRGEDLPYAAEGGGSTGGSTTGGADGGDSASVACTKTGEPAAVSAEKGGAPSITWGHGRFAVAWETLDNTPHEVRLSILSPNGDKLSEQVVATLAGTQALPRVHSTENGFGVVFQDKTPNGLVIRARDFGVDGAPSAPHLDVGTSQAAEARPAAAARESGVVIGWMEPQSSVVGLLSGSSMGATTPLSGARFPAIAAGDGASDIGIAWSLGSTLMFAPGSIAAGAPQVLTSVSLRAGTGDANLPRLTHGQELWFVAWEDTRASVERVYLRTVGSDGTIEDEVRVDEGEDSSNWPDIAWTGEHAAVVYYQFEGGPPAVYLTLFGADRGRVYGPARISGKNARFPSIAAAESALGIAWAVNDGSVEFMHIQCN